ncbi:MAG: hypothetical protein GY697_28910 [Desulfobacterales bacterium]|nr:hypothetical protein [Desulfobacterales bacterium]
MPADIKTVLSKLMQPIGRAFLRRLERPIPSYEKRIINNMDNLYSEIRPGDVVLVEGNSRLSRIIQLMTNSSWSHAALYIGDRLTAEKRQYTQSGPGEPTAVDRQHMLVEADGGNGVIAVPLNKYKDFNIRICRPFGISAPDITLVIDTTIANLGKHYDHENLLDLALLTLPPFLNPFKRRTIQACLGGCTDYRVICSGMIASAFQKVGYPIVPALLPGADNDSLPTGNPYGSRLVMRHFSHIVPRDFDLSPNFEVIKYHIIRSGSFNYKSIWA